MKINKYQEEASKTINKDLTKDEQLLNGVMGLCGEAGEVIDIIKKEKFHGHPLDKEHLIKELGDVCWYIAECATALDIELEEIMQKNLEKLKKRYPEGFDKEKSLHRNKDDI